MDVFDSLKDVQDLVASLGDRVPNENEKPFDDDEQPIAGPSTESVSSLGRTEQEDFAARLGAGLGRPLTPRESITARIFSGGLTRRTSQLGLFFKASMARVRSSRFIVPSRRSYWMPAASRASSILDEISGQVQQKRSKVYHTCLA